MSDQGERGVRWTDMSESEPRDESREDPRTGETTGPQAAFPDSEAFPEAPEGFPAPAGAESSGSAAASAHDVWGKVEEPRQASAEPDRKSVV